MQKNVHSLRFFNKCKSTLYSQILTANPEFAFTFLTRDRRYLPAFIHPEDGANGPIFAKIHSIFMLFEAIFCVV